MGKKQRLTQFMNFTNAEVLALLANPRTPREDRQAALREAKFRGLRNIQKRGGR